MPSIDPRFGQIPIYDPNDSPKGRVFRTIGALIALRFVGLAWFSTCSKSTPNAKFIPASQLKAEFNQINRPRQAIADGELRTTTKNLEVTISQNYFWPSGSPPLLESYRAVLSASGWRDKAQLGGGVGVLEIFCKGTMEASLQEMRIDANGTSWYDFSITNGTMSATDCQETGSGT